MKNTHTLGIGDDFHRQVKYLQNDCTPTGMEMQRPICVFLLEQNRFPTNSTGPRSKFPVFDITLPAHVQIPFTFLYGV